MKKLQWLALLMGVAIVGITGFQVYWLKENYDRESKTLAIKCQVLFKDAIQRLQFSKLKFNGLPGDSLNDGKVSVFVDDGNHKNLNLRFTSKDEIMSTINILRKKFKDSIPPDPNIRAGMVISMEKSAALVHGDTDRFNRNLPFRKGDQIIQMLYGIDSLQDSIKVNEIEQVTAKELKSQKLDIPFSVQRIEKTKNQNDASPNDITVGFVNPITFKLALGNTFPYLMKRISLPILFSILLLGITGLSFLLLYRNVIRQQKLGVLKNEFISNITHELKTPIATVGVAIEALKNFNAIEDPRRTREYLDISSNELQRLSLLVDKVLKLSMFEKKEIDLKYEPANLKTIVDEVVNSMKLQTEKYHAKVSVNAEGNLDLEADKLHLQSVVYNLLDNALKYGNENAEIQIRLQDQGDKVMLSMEDNGIGIPPEYHEKIFEKFFRIPHGDTHNAKGYGLGLSYVSHVVKKHQGAVAMESSLGKGTKITITIPRNPS